MTAPLPIAVLISGGGTTLRNLIALRDAGELPVDIRLVISSNATARGLTIAHEAGIPTLAAAKGKLTSDEYASAIFEPCRQVGVRIVVMGGFLKHVTIPPDFENRVVNIHPGLIPAFCGPGMYGQHVHDAVLAYGAKVSGCTVHFVDNQYDHGPIILQQAVPVFDHDSAHSLAARVFAAECQALPAALRLLASDRIDVTGRVVHIRE